MSRYAPDTFLNGQILVKQEKNGYRFSIDAVLLSNFVCVKSQDVVVDLGTGCGILPMILAMRNPDTFFWGVEIQTALAKLALENVQENDLEHMIRIINEDMKNLTHAQVSGPVDVVVSNPPYRKADSGRINPDSQRAVARHEIMVTLQELLHVAGKLLRTAGKFFIIYPADRTIDLLAGMRDYGIEPKRIRTIHSLRHTPAKLILVEGAKGGNPGIQIMPPLIIYQDQDHYTEEVNRMFLP